jgi:hypothetical protein
MKANEGFLDRIVRIVLGLVAWLAAMIVGTGPWSMALVVIGFILIVTGAAGFCPLYRLFGFKTTAPAAATTPEGPAQQDEEQRKHAA